MILSFRGLWSLSTRRGTFPAFPRSEQQTLGQIEPRGSRGVTGIRDGALLRCSQR
jgi:hypothetical protein